MKDFADVFEREKSEYSGVRLEFVDNREAVIDGCKGVIDCTENSVSINLGRKHLHIQGKNLSIRNFEKNRIEIEGFFTGILFD